MTEFSLPWGNLTTGDARYPLGYYSAQTWSNLWMSLLGSSCDQVEGALWGSQPAGDLPLQVQESSPAGRSIRVGPGAALIEGTIYVNTADINFPVPNNWGGADRYYFILLRKDRTNQSVRLILAANYLETTDDLADYTILLTNNAQYRELVVGWARVTAVGTSLVNYRCYQWGQYVGQRQSALLTGILNDNDDNTVTLVTGDAVFWKEVGISVALNPSVSSRTSHPYYYKPAGFVNGIIGYGNYGTIQTEGIIHALMPGAVGYIAAQGTGDPSGVIRPSGVSVPLNENQIYQFCRLLESWGTVIGEERWVVEIHLKTPGNQASCIVREYEEVTVDGPALAIGKNFRLQSTLEVSDPDDVIDLFAGPPLGLELQVKGIYLVRGWVTADQVNNHKATIEDGGGKVLLIGSNSAAVGNKKGVSYLEGIIRIPLDGYTIYLCDWVQTASATGTGRDINLGSLQETFAFLEIQRLTYYD